MHENLGHISRTYLQCMAKTNEKLAKINFGASILDCEICIAAKMTRLPFKNDRKEFDH